MRGRRGRKGLSTDNNVNVIMLSVRFQGGRFKGLSLGAAKMKSGVKRGTSPTKGLKSYKSLTRTAQWWKTSPNAYVACVGEVLIMRANNDDRWRHFAGPLRISPRITFFHKFRLSEHYRNCGAETWEDSGNSETESLKRRHFISGRNEQRSQFKLK